MTNAFEKIADPLERMMARFQHLLETDEQIRSIMPLPDVAEAAAAEGLSTAERIDTVLTGYAGRGVAGYAGLQTGK